MNNNSMPPNSGGRGGKLVSNPYNIKPDIEELNKQKADKNNIDGEWTNILTSNPLILSNVSLPIVNGSGTLEFDISALLPADNNTYEISYLINVVTAAVKNAYTDITVYGTKGHYSSIGVSTNSAVSNRIAHGDVANIGSDRKLRIQYSNNVAAGMINSLRINVFRKKGENGESLKAFS